MCGFTGFLTRETSNAGILERDCLRMREMLAHRGPDDAGMWTDAAAGIALGHRRLSIVDLSPAGHQPMHSACGRYVIAFNGEIYNFLDIRKELDNVGRGVQWKGHSDTEVILAAIRHWGLDETLPRLTGMFSFALWDRGEHTLYLARDRMGEKPLYYGWMGNVFLFGSELKALCVHPRWNGEIDRDALALYVRHNYVPTPFSIYKNVYKLLPGTVLTVRTQQTDWKDAVAVPYWSMKHVAEEGARHPNEFDENETVEGLERVLRSAIAKQMVADVPLGAFLSGGIDSSAVVALMQAQSDRPVKTFTIGFDESGYNEAEHAKAVATHLGTDHTELYASPADAMAVIPKLPTLYDEPFADSSQIPTFLVSQLARAHVTVSLSGDGGDELFGGYNRYFWATSIWNKMRWVPRPARRFAAAGMTSVAPQNWDRIFASLSSVLPTPLKQRTPGDKIHKLANVLAVRSPEEMYRSFVSHWEKPSDLVLDAIEPRTPLTDSSVWAVLPNFAQRMMYLDAVTYLPDDILVKVDRAAMGVSLETRVPMLDHHVVEFAWRLPMHMKVRHGKGKWALRQVLYRHVPRSLVERPKTGFGIPLDVWLRGPLREWAEHLLDERRLTIEGFFDPAPIRKKWCEHLAGLHNWQYYLWDILMFQAWLDNNGSQYSR